ncbi:MAG: ATP-binding cassette domain-containing protein [Proteobacteria bacterium]|nr:ATP-binding cassette domain-containing protein [Pseudomonadota bacterium]
MTSTELHADESKAAVVVADNVSKRFGDRIAVDGLNLTVPYGGCFGLLGPNGAGKTTTLKMAYGVARPTSGTVRVFGIDVAKDTRAVRQRLGVTLQENVLIDTISTRDNLRVFGRYYLLDEDALTRRIEELLEFLELRSHADAPARTLSGGYKRRLSVAMSLINKPELLILDEPTTGLDPAVRHTLWSRIRDLRAAGTTVLLTTHYMDEAERLCDRVVIIDQGKAMIEGVPRELIEQHLALEAVEIDCTPDEEIGLIGALVDGNGKDLKRLRAGNRVMLFTDNATAIVARIHQIDGGTRRPFMVRPANLEDVFLSITGTGLREGA